MGKELDLDDVAAGHPVALRELAALRALTERVGDCISDCPHSIRNLWREWNALLPAPGVAQEPEGKVPTDSQVDREVAGRFCDSPFCRGNGLHVAGILDPVINPCPLNEVPTPAPPAPESGGSACHECGGEGGHRWMEGTPDDPQEMGSTCGNCQGSGIEPITTKSGEGREAR